VTTKWFFTSAVMCEDTKMKLEIEGYRKVVSKKNKLKFSRRHGRAYKPKDVKEFEAYVQEVADKARQEYEAATCVIWPTDKKYRLILTVTFGDKVRRDVQNTFSCICDALEGIVYDDDCQIVEIYGKKEYEKDTWKFKIDVEVI
jgi:Holliday junction resolvase RusA-like endonuclease